MARAPVVYEARFGLNRQVLVTVLVAIALTALAVATHVSAVVTVASVALFGAGGLIMLLIGLGGGVALRVDADGITHRGPGLGPLLRPPPVTMAWPSVRRVLLFDQVVGFGTFGRIPYIGVALHPGMLPPRGGSGRPWATRLAAGLLSHVPPDVIPLSRQVVGFEIDRARLIDAVAANAPDVEVVDIDLDGAVYPASPERPRRSPWTWR
jgi:hypothetical protein